MARVEPIGGNSVDRLGSEEAGVSRILKSGRPAKKVCGHDLIHVSALTVRLGEDTVS